MRQFKVLLAMATIVGAMAGVSAAAYWLAYLANKYWFDGAGRLANILTLMLVFVMIIATLLTLAERKWSAMMQDRIGPDRARINLPGIKNRSLAGIPHIVADVLKLLTKEILVPARVNRLMYELAPLLAFAPVFALFAVVPAGPSVVFQDGVKVDMVVASPDFGILYLFAVASLAVYGTSLAGWASNNKFALLGGVRASSQMISYEVALGLSLVGIFLCFSSVQLPALANAQAGYLWGTHAGGVDIGLPMWGLWLQPIGFILFFAAAFAETKRAPFDVPEGESEIIGYFVEYSGMRFGLFMIAEFVEVVVLSGVITVLFLGGWHLPFGTEAFATWATTNNHPVIYGTVLGTVFWIKVLVLIFIQLVIRWTFPRFRYDQIQTLGWKILLPLGLVNVFVTAALVLWDPTLRSLAILGFIEIIAVVALAMAAKPAEETTALAHGGHGHDDHGHPPAHPAPAAGHH